MKKAMKSSLTCHPQPNLLLGNFADLQTYISKLPSISYNCRDYTSLENILNPPEEEQGINAAEELTRVTINPKTRQISSETHLTGIDSELSRYAQKFDFPTINEAYRGKEVL